MCRQTHRVEYVLYVCMCNFAACIASVGHTTPAADIHLAIFLTIQRPQDQGGERQEGREHTMLLSTLPNMQYTFCGCVNMRCIAVFYVLGAHTYSSTTLGLTLKHFPEHHAQSSS